MPEYFTQADPIIERSEYWARSRLAEGFSLEDAARALAIGARHCTENAIGKSALELFQDMRVERARHLVDRGQDIASVAAAVAYADTTSLRNLLRRRLGSGVRELRLERLR